MLLSIQVLVHYFFSASVLFLNHKNKFSKLLHVIALSKLVWIVKHLCVSLFYTNHSKNIR